MVDLVYAAHNDVVHGSREASWTLQGGFQALPRNAAREKRTAAALTFGSAYKMETPYTSASFRPETAFATAAERFFELLRTCGLPAAPGAGRIPDWSALAGPLAGQFEQWLRMSQAAGPWFNNPGAATVSPAASTSTGPAWPFGPLPFGPPPLGPAAAPSGEAQRTFELLGRLAQLQAQLAAHWSEVAQTAARSFVARLGAPGNAGTAAADNPLKLYELWVNCAEEAYAATAHKDDFCRLQGELANTSAALLVEQRRHAETLVRAFGLPTRNEMDALYGQLKELRGQLAQLSTVLAPAGAARGGTAPPQAAAPSAQAAAAPPHTEPRSAARRGAAAARPKDKRPGKRPRKRRPRT
jgi:Poly(R)-hydroxyalkanoic acid synthase subunit (PHA_synth_III_E)